MISQAPYTKKSLVFFPMKKPTIPERIELVKKELDLTEDTEFGKLCGMSKSVVNQLKTGKMKSFAARYAYRLEENSCILAKWLQLGEGPMKFDPDISQTIKLMEKMNPENRRVAIKIITPLVGSGET